MNEHNKNLLTSMYQNCQTGLQSLQNIESGCQDDNLLEEIHAEYQKYNGFATKCQEIAAKYNEELTDNNLLEKARLWTSIKMTTLMDNSTRHLAEMLMLGTVMGTLQCYKDLSDHREADKPLLELCGDLLKMEERNFENLRKFLKKL